MVCQTENIDNLCRQNSPGNRLFQFPVRNMKRVKMALSALSAKLGRSRRGRMNSPSTAVPRPTLRPGDLVSVRSREEIERTLDGAGTLGGCHFMREMYACCGKTYRVLKVVDQFYDEVTQKICRSRDTVLLEGAVCSGRQRLYRSRCDRNCFFFWRTAWLDKSR